MDISDHFMTFVQCPIKLTPKPKKQIPTRKFSKQNVGRFREHLKNLSWEDVLNNANIDESFNLFWTNFKSLFDLCFPLTQTKFNKNVHGISNYITPGLLVSRQTKLKLLKTLIKTPNQVNSLAYKNYRNLYNKTLRASKKLYYDNSLAKAKNNPKKTWNIMKEALNLNHSKPKIEKIVENNVTLTEPSDISNAFNSFFAGAAHST